MSEIYEMNIDEIEKYIIGKKIKDMSLEEIRNFIETQGNTIILNHHIYEKQQLETERLNNIIKRLEEFIEKEIEIYTLELTEKNTNALSYSLPIKAVYKEIYNVLQELKGSDKE